jgi:hypothetical protein
VRVALAVQLDNLAQQVMEQTEAIQFFLPSPLQVVAVAVLVGLLVLEKQVVLAEVAVITAVLAAQETRLPHPQVKVTTVAHQSQLMMAVAAVVGLLLLVQQLPLWGLEVQAGLVQPQALAVLQ